MDFGLKGKVAIVTGAAGGIGGAIARDLSKEGVNLSLSYHINRCDALIEEIQKSGVEVTATRADVTKLDEIERLIKVTYEKYGEIDILVNNAGVRLTGAIENTKLEDWDRVIEINLRSVFMLSRAVIGIMKKQKWGRIINIGSIIAKNATNATPWINPESSNQSGGAAYSASKAAVHALTKTLAKELASFHITVNCIAPGPIKTGMVKKLSESLTGLVPVGRIGEPEEVSAFVVLLASERAGYVTGEIIDINGGLWMD